MLVQGEAVERIEERIKTLIFYKLLLKAILEKPRALGVSYSTRSRALHMRVERLVVDNVGDGLIL